MAARRRPRGRLAGAPAVGVVAALLAALLAGCGGGVEGSVVAPTDPVCDAVATVADVWGTSAPASLLSNPDGLADFAAGLQGGFARAVAVLRDDAPPEVDANLDVVAAALDAQYGEALAYAAGDMSAAPTLSPADRTALAGVEAWSTQRCPGVDW